MFKNKEIEKTYMAICQGKPKVLESISYIEIPSKEKKNLKHKTETYYKVIKINNNLSQIIYIPKTGKTHQLRIVSKKLGCSIRCNKKTIKCECTDKDCDTYYKKNIDKKRFKILKASKKHIPFEGWTEELFKNPNHEYTKELLTLMPKIESIYN